MNKIIQFPNGEELAKTFEQVSLMDSARFYLAAHPLRVILVMSGRTLQSLANRKVRCRLRTSLDYSSYVRQPGVTYLRIIVQEDIASGPSDAVETLESILDTAPRVNPNERRGRPRILGEDAVRRTLYLESSVAQSLMQMGGGQISPGLRVITDPLRALGEGDLEVGFRRLVAPLATLGKGDVVAGLGVLTTLIQERRGDGL